MGNLCCPPNSTGCCQWYYFQDVVDDNVGLEGDFCFTNNLDYYQFINGAWSWLFNAGSGGGSSIIVQGNVLYGDYNGATYTSPSGAFVSTNVTPTQLTDVKQIEVEMSFIVDSAALGILQVVLGTTPLMTYSFNNQGATKYIVVNTKIDIDTASSQYAITNLYERHSTGVPIVNTNLGMTSLIHSTESLGSTKAISLTAVGVTGAITMQQFTVKLFKQI